MSTPKILLALGFAAHAVAWLIPEPKPVEVRPNPYASDPYVVSVNQVYRDCYVITYEIFQLTKKGRGIYHHKQYWTTDLESFSEDPCVSMEPGG